MALNDYSCVTCAPDVCCYVFARAVLLVTAQGKPAQGRRRTIWASTLRGEFTPDLLSYGLSGDWSMIVWFVFNDYPVMFLWYMLIVFWCVSYGCVMVFTWFSIYFQCSQNDFRMMFLCYYCDCLVGFHDCLLILLWLPNEFLWVS